MAEADAAFPNGRLQPLPAWTVYACLILAAIHVTFFVMGYGRWWILDEQGRGIVTDFVDFWTAGRFTLEGHPALAYDWDMHKARQVATLGQDFTGHFAFGYPPIFLALSAAMAMLPYATAFVVWSAVSFVPFAVLMRHISGDRFGWLLAASFPAVLVNVLTGHTGFLSTALMGAALVLMPASPVLSGLFIGLLAYKPQLGLLFPLVLVATGQWRVFLSAALTVCVLASAAFAGFGADSWAGFVETLPKFSQAFLTEGRAPWGKMQSLFALVRLLDGSEPLAWAFQLTFDAIVVAALLVLWRGAHPYWLKAAGLATATLLVTPYLFLYDVTILAIPVALLIRNGRCHGFRRHELPVLACAFVLIASYVFLCLPTGFLACVLVGGLIAARAREMRPMRAMQVAEVH